LTVPITEAPSDQRSSTDLLIIGVGFFSFIVLGIPGALLNVAWSPSIRSTFGLSLDAVGALFLTNTVGYFLASSISGRLMSYLGIGRLLTLSAVISAVGLLGYVLAPSWRWMLLCGLLVGSGGGMLDGGMNIYFAAKFGPRPMNWLHACFGIGATLSPLAMTAILTRGASWRWGYGLAVLAYAAAALLFALTRRRWRLEQATGSAGQLRSATAWETLQLPLVWLGIALFVLLTGLEVSAGQWAFPLFTESRHASTKAAGQWVGIYWGSFTVGRLFFGAIVPWIRPAVLIRLCIVGMALGAAVLGWNPWPGAGVLGLALLGFALSPLFALLITRTQEQLGSVHAPNAIGLQVGAAGLGVGLVPGLGGVLAQRLGLEIVPLYLLGLTIVLFVLYEASNSRRIGTQSAPVPAVDPYDSGGRRGQDATS
jgi:fucose permease